jgi:acyl-CoA synthetase (NDP forming)
VVAESLKNGILCADACEAHGLLLAELAESTVASLTNLVPQEASLANPVDLLGSATASTYEAVVPALLADPHVDALIVLFVPPVVAGAEEVGRAICDAVAGAASDKPVVAVVISAEGTPSALRDPASPVVALPYPESAARALALVAERADWLRRPTGVLRELSGLDMDTARTVVQRALHNREEAWLGAAELRRVLAAYGVPVVAEHVADSADEAVEAAAALGYPVVVKTAEAGAHKTERGGVALDLGNEDDVREAAERIGPPLIVQRYVRRGAELLAGIVQDPIFGPLVAFGPGGVFAELIGQAGFRIAPPTDVDARELVLGGKAGTLVRGFRGTAPADADALVDLIERLGRLAEEIPEITELDLNPVIAHPDGCVVVDARARAVRVTAPRAVKGW